MCRSVATRMVRPAGRRTLIGMIEGLAMWRHRHRWTPLSTWLAVVIGVTMLAGATGSTVRDPGRHRGSDSAKATGLADAGVPGGRRVRRTDHVPRRRWCRRPPSRVRAVRADGRPDWWASPVRPPRSTTQLGVARRHDRVRAHRARPRRSRWRSRPRRRAARAGLHSRTFRPGASGRLATRSTRRSSPSPTSPRRRQTTAACSLCSRISDRADPAAPEEGDPTGPRPG